MLLALGWLLLVASAFAPALQVHILPFPNGIYLFGAESSAPLWQALILTFVRDTPLGTEALLLLGLPFMASTIYWVDLLGEASVAQRLFSLGLLGAWAFPVLVACGVAPSKAWMELEPVSPPTGIRLFAVAHTLAFVAFQIGPRRERRKSGAKGTAAGATRRESHVVRRPRAAGARSSVGRAALEPSAPDTGSDRTPQAANLSYPAHSVDGIDYLPAIRLASEVAPWVTLTLAGLIGAIEWLDRYRGLSFHLPGVAPDETLELFCWLAAALGAGGAGASLYVGHRGRRLLHPYTVLAVVVNVLAASAGIVCLKMNGLIP